MNLQVFKVAANSILGSLLLLLVVAGLGGCASSQQRVRKEQRDKLVQTAKLYCEFLNGEQFHDIDDQLRHVE